MNSNDADRELIFIWRAFSEASGHNKQVLFMTLVDSAIDFWKQNIISTDYAAYRICHCIFDDKDLPDDLRRFIDEACELELGPEYVSNYKERWNQFLLDGEALKQKYVHN